MSTDENKAAIRRLNKAINKGDWSVIPEIFAPEFVFHAPQEARGHEGIKQLFVSMRTAFPDFQEKIEHMIAEGDMVAVTYTLTGTFQGKLGDNEPTGKKFSMPTAVVARFRKGKQVEAWPYYDLLAWGRQLGISQPG